MANADNNMTDEIDWIVTHHIETIDKLFEDLKKALATPEAATAAVSELGSKSESSTANPKCSEESIDIAKQRTKETCFTFILAITKWIRKEYSMPPNQCAQLAEKSKSLPTILENLKLD